MLFAAAAIGLGAAGLNMWSSNRNMNRMAKEAQTNREWSLMSAREQREYDTQNRLGQIGQFVNSYLLGRKDRKAQIREQRGVANEVASFQDQLMATKMKGKRRMRNFGMEKDTRAHRRNLMGEQAIFKAAAFDDPKMNQFGPTGRQQAAQALLRGFIRRG